MCHWLWRQHLSAADLQVRGIQCGHVQKRSWQQRVGMFPTWRNTENSKSPGQALVTTPMFLFLTSCVCCLPPLADWLQVHAVDEVIWLLCGEGSGFLQLVTNESETTADHEQQQSGDDQAEGQRKDCTYRRKTEVQSSRIKEQYNDINQTFQIGSYLTLVLDAPPLQEMVWRWGRHSLVGSGRL